MRPAATDLTLSDRLPLMDHSIIRTAQHHPRHGAQPVLWRWPMAQDRLRDLTINAPPPRS